MRIPLAKGYSKSSDIASMTDGQDPVKA